MKKLLAVLLALVMLVSLAACAGNTDKDNPSSDAPANSDNPSMKANVNKKIAMIMQQGGLGDQGFNDTAYAGLMTCKEKYDQDVNAVECTDTTQGETLIRELCEAGYGLIINLEAGISGNMYTVARDYPDIYFVVVGRQLRINAVDGFTETPKNVIESYITLNEHSFLAGVVAAFAATDGNTLVEGVGQHEGCNIGILFGAESVGFYQYGDGFRQGALFYNPDAKVYIDYTVGFSDTAIAQCIAQNMIINMGTTQLQAVAAINHATKGTYLEQIKRYEEAGHIEAVQPLVELLVSLRAKFEEAAAHVEQIEKETCGFKELHARRLVEMAGYLAITHLLALQAGEREEYHLSAEIYGKIAASKSYAAAETAGQARTGYLPRLAMDGSFTATVRHFDGVERWTFSLLPQLVQPVYGGGAVRAAARQAELGYGSALCDEEFSRLDVRYAADYAYWNLSAVELYAASMRQYVAIIRSLKEVVDRRFSEGYIAKGDVLMIDARLSEAEYSLVSAEQSYEVALHNFNILRGTDAALGVQLAQGIRDSLPMPGRVGAAEALERRPDYAAARLRSEQAEAGIRAVRAPFNPQLSVGVGGMWQPYYPNSTGATYVDGSAFVKLSVPIFHWGERRRAVGAARAVQLQQDWNAALVHDDIVREEMNGWTALVQSRAQVDASEESLRIAGENLSISTYSYGEGLATILDVLQAQLSWIQLYSNAIRAHYNYAVAVSDYQRITAQ